LLHFGDCEFPTFENVIGSKRESLWISKSLRSGVCYFSSILEITNPVDGGPVSKLAVFSFSLFRKTDSNSSKINSWINIEVVSSIGSKYVWAGLVLNCGGSANNSCYYYGYRLFHYYYIKSLIKL
jgi:hypothetical protein